MYEKYISDLLLLKGINSIEKLNIRDLADAFGINIYYFNCGTCLIIEEDEKYCIIDNKANKVTQYEKFLHELAHFILGHSSFLHQDNFQWKHYERKADHLIQFIAIPLFLVKDVYDLKTITEVSEYFSISYDLAYKRLVNIRHRQLIKLIS